jgi:hypothetical protein
MIVFRAGANNVAFAGWRKTGGVVRWCLTLRVGTGYLDVYSSTTPVVNHWYNVELYWGKDAVNGFGVLMVDGVEVCGVGSRNTAAYVDVSQIRLGLAILTNCASATLYCDNCQITDYSRVPP